jgi:hypothetical protein
MCFPHFAARLSLFDNGRCPLGLGHSQEKRRTNLLNSKEPESSCQKRKESTMPQHSEQEIQQTLTPTEVRQQLLSIIVANQQHLQAAAEVQNGTSNEPMGPKIVDR